MEQLAALRRQGQPVGPVAAEGIGFLSPILTQGLAFWHRIRGDAPIPRRDDMLPESIVSLWPYILMVDVIGAGADYHFRLVGGHLVSVYGEQTGRDLSTARVPELVRQRCKQIFDFCLGSAAPAYEIGRAHV